MAVTRFITRSLNTALHESKGNPKLIESLNLKNFFNKVNNTIDATSRDRHFAVVYMYSKQKLVTEGDMFYLYKDVPADLGDKIKLEKIMLVGNDKLTLIGRPLLDRDLVHVEATVVEKTQSHTFMGLVAKKRSHCFRRYYFQRKPLTILRINEIRICHNVNSSHNVNTLQTDISSILDHHSYNILNEELYIKHKVEAYNRLTSDITSVSFAINEEKYQTKTSKIIEIYYSLDESMRPKELRAHDVDYMIKMKNPKVIRNYIKKVAKAEKNREKSAEIRAEIRDSIRSQPKPGFGVSYEESGKPVYRVHSVSPICSWAACKRIRQHNYTKIAQSKLLNAQKVVIDFDYNEHMTLKEHLTITAQIKICIGNLRKSREPVDLYFCNFNPTSPAARLLELDFGPPSSYLVEATPKSYLDLFPKEKLVYLTADTDNVLQYDPKDIYIIGGMIDAQSNEPVSAAKALKEGLRMAKLPLNEHVRIRNEVKSLKISQVFGIISDLSSTDGNIKEALNRNIPLRIQSEKEIDNLFRKHSLENERVKNYFKEKFSLSEEEAEAMVLLSLYYRDTRNV